MTRRILVVEDQEDNRRIVRDLLTSAGYELIEALDGEAGVRLAEAERPDLILVDVQLPVLDLAVNALAFLCLAMIRLMLRRLTRASQPS